MSDKKETAMQELHRHLIEAWSGPGDLWNPDKIIDKVKSMIPKEREQIVESFERGYDSGYVGNVAGGIEYCAETFNSTNTRIQ